ncbi:galactose mutarotase-like domain-containing protein [Neurospora intermedia]|uniref:Glucose-6-phosphate 1-epimerase n=1 Tax=Neurospora intermedia TaxID=5142 RepID=A0ABR3DSV9_NEUIN
MVDRGRKPSALASTPGLPPQPQVTFSADNSRVTATLPTGESVSVLLYGATVVSWKDKNGDEKLWLSEAAKLDGSKPVRGGIPLVFPVFGTAPDHAQTKNLPQHGFARSSRWEFLGKSTSESTPTPTTPAFAATATSAAGAVAAAAADLSVKLDFGLSSSGLSEDARAKWPYAFNAIYSVTLNTDSLTTNLVITNDDERSWECQMLMHTYLRVNDITSVSIHGLENASYVDKTTSPISTSTQTTSALTISSETDRVYTPAGDDPASIPITVFEGDQPKYTVLRDNLANVVVWNPWIEKAKGMADFEPKDGYKNMLCVEPGAVATWQVLEPGDAFEGAQTIVLGGKTQN